MIEGIHKGFLGETQVLTASGFEEIRALESPATILCPVIKDYKACRLVPKRAVVHKIPVKSAPAIKYSGKISISTLEDHAVYGRRWVEEPYNREELKNIYPYDFKMHPINFGLYERSRILSIYDQYGKFEKFAETKELFNSDSFSIGFVVGSLFFKGSLKGKKIIYQTKDRTNISILARALSNLKIDHIITCTEVDGQSFYVCRVSLNPLIYEYIGIYTTRISENELVVPYSNLSRNELLGIYFGISHAGAWPLFDRNIQNIYTKNESLLNLFQYICFAFGFECHLNKRNSKKNSNVCCMNFNENLIVTYKSKERERFMHSGSVYSISCDSDYVVARGNDYEFAYIIGAE